MKQKGKQFVVQVPYKCLVMAGFMARSLAAFFVFVFDNFLG